MKRSLPCIAAFLLWSATAVAQDVDATLRAARQGDGAAAVTALTPFADQGHAGAQYALGVIYANGEGLTVDREQAAKWFAAAARGGHVEARRHLLFMQQLGLVATAAPPPPVDAVFRIQVASVGSEADATREWRRLQRRHPEALATLESSFAAFDRPDGARIYRVQGGPLDEDTARAVCARLRNEGTTCFIVRP
jgi:TPR repeat protein